MRLSRLTRWLLWTGFVFLLLMTALRLAFFNSFNKQGNSAATVGDSFLLGLRFDLRLVALVLLPVLLIGSIGYFNPFNGSRARKSWLIYFGIASFALVFFYMVDFAHYSYLSQRLNASVLNYLEDAGISASMVWQSYPVVWMILILLGGTALVTWIVWFGYRLVSKRKSETSRRNRALAFFVTFVLFAVLIFGRFDQYPLRWSDAFALGNDYKANLALNPFESFVNTLKFRGTTYDLEKVRELYPVISRYYGLDSARPLNYDRSVTFANRIPPPNVVLVICESFSAYKSSMWNNPLNTTPFFDKMARNGVFFDRCFTPSYGTARGVWATITGLPDVEMPTTSSRNPSAVDQHTIINDFDGYEKYYFIGGSPSWANIRGLLMNNISGLHLFDQESFDAPRLDVWGISDKNLFLESNKVLAKESKPFFAVIQTADNHRPYTIPSEDTDFISRKPPEDSLDRFGFSDQISYSDKLKEYNAFRYTDYTFRKFMEAAQKEKYYDNTIFVFIGDHGIPGDVGNVLPRVWTSQRLTSLHVPLLFYSPRYLQARRSDTICSQMDVLPSIAGLCMVPYTNSALGRNLFDSRSEKPFAFLFDPDYRQTGIIMNDYLLRRHLQTGNEEFVPLNTLAESSGVNSDSLRNEMRQLNLAVYETSRYLLFNNKKKNQSVK